MCSCFNICVMTVFQQRANVFFLSTTTTKKRKVFYFWCLHVFWSWSLQTILRRFCLPISFYFFFVFFDFFEGVSSLGSISNSLEEDGGSISFALFRSVIFVFFAGGCWSSSSFDDSKRVRVRVTRGQVSRG